MLAGLAAVLLVGVSNGHAAPVQNTAAETVNPFFSTGTSSNLSQNKTGFISLSGSGDDRQGSGHRLLGEFGFGNRLVTVVCSGSGTLEHCPYACSGTGSWLLVGDDRLRLARGAVREVAHAIDLVLRRVRFNGGMILPAGSLRAHPASSVPNSD